MTAALFVGNLASATTEEDLADLFAQAGTVQRVRIPTDRDTNQPRGFGFVEMETQDEAQAAIRQFDGYHLGGREIRVSIAEARRGGRR